MDDIERTIWRDRLRNRSCSMYGSEPLDVTNANRRNEQYKVSCLHKLVDLVDLRWKTIAEAAYERDNPTAFEIPKWRITDHAQRYSARRTNPPTSDGPIAALLAAVPGPGSQTHQGGQGFTVPLTKFRKVGNQDGRGQRSCAWHWAFHPGPLFAVPSSRCPTIGFHAKPTALWSMPAATQRTPATRPPDAFHWTTPRPYAPKPTSRKST